MRFLSLLALLVVIAAACSWRRGSFVDEPPESKPAAEAQTVSGESPAAPAQRTASYPTLEPLPGPAVPAERPAPPLFPADGRARQVPDAAAIFRRSTAPVPGAIAAGLLVCETRLFSEHWDEPLFGGVPDVKLDVRVGGGPLRHTPVRESRVHSFPVSDLQLGDAIEVTVLDQDTVFDDMIAHSTHRFDGAPFVIRTGHADVECRAAPSLLVEARQAAVLETIDHQIQSFATEEPDLLARDLGFPRRRAELGSVADEALVWVDSADPRFLVLMEEARRFDDSWFERVEEATSDLQERLPPPSTPVRFGPRRTVSAHDVACGVDALVIRQGLPLEPEGGAGRLAGSGGCLVVLEVSPSEGALDLSETWTLARDASVRRVRAIAVGDGETWVSAEGSPAARSPASSQNADAPSHVLLEVGKRPALLRVGGRRPVLLRLE